MRVQLWPESSPGEHREEIERYFSSPRTPASWEVLVAEERAGRLLGFAELSIRGYAEACTTSHVAYLEGWFVESEVRRRGVGRALIAAAETWGREQGCTEFASDAEVDNHTSRLAHEASGFTDVGLVRCFRKEL